MYIDQLVNESFLAGLMVPMAAPVGKVLTKRKPEHDRRGVRNSSRWLVYDENIDTYVEVEGVEVEGIKIEFRIG